MALLVSEIYTSLAGETSWVGLPCVFIRLAGCNLNCSWCDTPYARDGGEPMSVNSLVDKALESAAGLVCVTGGEPLLQKETPSLARKLIRKGLHVLVETNGSLPVETLPDRAHKVVDVKTPSSGEAGSFLKKNLSGIRKRDELKFVVADMNDFDWAARFVKRHGLAGKCGLLVSPAWGSGADKSDGRKFSKELAERVASSGIPFRYNMQLHKVIWGPKRRGV